jgi:hypothetical protein
MNEDKDKRNDKRGSEKQIEMFFEELLGQLLRVDRFKYGWRSILGIVVCLVAVGVSACVFLKKNGKEIYRNE